MLNTSAWIEVGSAVARVNSSVAGSVDIFSGLTLACIAGGAPMRKSRPRLTLSQKLKLYDAAVHGGEVSTGGLVGKERF